MGGGYAAAMTDTIPFITILAKSGDELEFFEPEAARDFGLAQARVEERLRTAGLHVVRGDDFSGFSVVPETLLGQGDCGPVPGYASVELRTPVLTGAAGLKTRLHAYRAVLREDTFTDKFCGMHHTISVPEAAGPDGLPTLPQIANVYLGFQANIATYGAMIGEVRTQNDACNRALALTAEDWRQFGTVRAAQEATSRNSPLSLWSLVKYGAFELRGRGACAARRDLNGVISAIVAEVNFITALHYVPWPHVTWENAAGHCQRLENSTPAERAGMARAFRI